MQAAIATSELQETRAASLAVSSGFNLNQDMVKAALSRLSSRERLVLQFLYEERLSLVEAGAVMDMTIHDVRLHHAAALATLSEITQIPFPVL